MTPKFFVAGLSYKRSDISHRSRFAFNHDESVEVYNLRAGHFFILSTCNRTEVYGFSSHEEILKDILCQKAGASREEMAALVYTKSDDEAVLHFFRVAAGLDSQIPGDYEIISQIKSSFTLAKQHLKTDGFMEKIFNYALQASKEIKNTTSFSDGTISVAWSVASQLERSDVNKVTILGAGDTGELMIKYLQKLRPDMQINLVNRDKAKLDVIAAKYDVLPFPISFLSEAVSDSDALVVTTNANHALVEKEHVEGTTLKLIFDLSVPRNVEAAVYDMIQVYDVDTVSKEINNTIENRLREVPKVEEIISRHIEEFKSWSLRRRLYSTYP
jgi:glutamyl-tRNA reductase